MRVSVLCFAAVLAFLADVPSSAHGPGLALTTPGGVFLPEACRALGVVRAWMSQVDVDSSRHRVSGLDLYEGTLYVQTTAGLIQAIDAETGETKWKRVYGNPRFPYAAGAFDDKYAAFQRGTDLFVLSRADGTLVWTKRVEGTLGIAPAIAQGRVIVALPSGRMESYVLAQPERLPRVLASFGRVTTSPIITKDHLVWATDRAKLMIRGLVEPPVERELSLPQRIEAPLESIQGLLFAGAMDGGVYCVRESDGGISWHEVVDGAVRERLVLAGGTLYVVTDLQKLYALASNSGRRLWNCGGVAQLVSVAEKSLYGLDELGRLVRIDRGNGQVVQAAFAGPASVTFTNAQTDRLYLSTPSGVLTCLHDEGHPHPMLHEVEAASPPDSQPSAAPSPQPPPAVRRAQPT